MFGNGNCDVDNEKTIVTSSKWTQCEIDDHKVSMASSTGGNRVMEKPGQELLQQQQQALRCPRCDSSNTKFCYYNNYSLTQPRHFCKACKRYWTRGGTLRNVPVGGGCRKNKRLKRPTYSCSNNNNIDSSASPSSSNPSSVVANPNPPSQSQQQQQQQQQQHHSFDIAATSNHINTMLYGGNNSCHDVMNFPFSTRFNSTRVSNPVSGYDNLHQNGLGLGFSSGILMSAGVGVGGEGGEVNLNHHHHHQHHHDEGSYRNGFSTSNNNNYSSIFGSTSTSSTPVMASLLSSTLLQQKFMSTGGGIKGGSGGGGGGDDDAFHHHHEMDSKEVKLGEGLQNRLDQWNMNNLNGNGGAAFQNQMENMGLSDNNSSLYWNNNHNSSNNNTAAAAAATGLGSVWSTDQPGSNSVTSLI